ncbi:MAG: DMT family transporter [Fusobacteriaceae bacterium]
MEIKGYFYGGLAGVLWGTSGMFGKKISELGLNGSEVTFVKMFFATILGLIFLFYTERKLSFFKVPKKTIKNIFFIGVLTQGLMNVFLFMTIIRIGIISAALLVSTGPIFTLVLSSWILKEELTLEKKIAMSFTITGGIIAITEGSLLNIKFDLIGVSYGLLASFFYGVYPIFGKKIDKSINPILVTVYSFLVALIFLIFIVDVSAVMDKISSIKGITLGIGFGVIPTLVGYSLFLMAVKYLPASKVSIMAMVEIPIGIILAIILLGEEFNRYKLTGVLFILVGIYISSLEFKNIFKRIKI